ncbi:phage tail assembly chaperone [Pseudomonas chlororaphis subsp. aurantiaca]|uniref:phage tail assembly chaperone n=1 Tax=Pseudomonas chlororaphis TaxID=587753 RepID=UPI0027DB3206|nr:phage tail assembly chaperone [Pseudomonas chlororaphis]WMJ01401.1 phage tail assembly chaperone [Pseudomonas chlororaphis subsp. aurantiaca]
MNYFCAADGGFYSFEFHGFIPEGSVEVSDADYLALQTGQSQGKRIVPNDRGYPVLIDPPPPSPEYFAEAERAWRDAQLSETDGVVSRHRDELEEDTETTLTPAQYTELQAYRRALRNWPEAGKFPLIEHRPSAPDWLADQLQ